MVYRLKIVRCLDIVVDEEDYREALLELREVISRCGGERAVYIHRLVRENDELVDKELVLSTTVKELLHHMLRQRGQP